MNRRLEELRAKQAELEAEVAAEERADSLLKAMPPQYQLACEMMRIPFFSRSMESWYYEFTNGEHEWYGYDHKTMLLKATRLLYACGGDMKMALAAAEAIGS
jgi:hypothetical protein